MHIFRCFYLVFLTGIIIFIFACGGDEEPTLENEEEVITTMRLSFIPKDGGNPIVFAYEDLDGPLGIPATIVNPPLNTNTLYTVSIELLNETVEPVSNISLEVEEEGTDHQFFFIQNPGNIFSSIEYKDTDDNGQPIGLEAEFRTSEQPIAGTLAVILRHQPDKSTTYTVGEAIPAAVGGETDIEVTFNVVLQ